MTSKEPKRLPSVKVYEVVVGVDYSSPSEQALQTALDMARRRSGSHIHVVAIAEGYAPNMSEDLTADAKAAFLAEAKATLEAYVDQELARRQNLFNRRSIFTIVDFGDPADRLVEIAKEVGANLIVVGTHGKGAVEQMLLGSVSQKVLRHAPCSVLVVRAEPEA
ncbi:MAG: universal stress protein [Polyangiaceae bacterium]|nr:universal stress protein [Polyangiaceae bacterium]